MATSAAPTMTLDERIDELLEQGGYNPHTAAAEIVANLSSREAKEYLAEALPLYIRQRLHLRRIPPSDALRDLKRFVRGEHFVDGRWVLAEQMDATDCAWLGEDYQKRSDGNGVWSDVWYDMARLLKLRQKATVGQLPEKDIKTALEKGVQ